MNSEWHRIVLIFVILTLTMLAAGLIATQSAFVAYIVIGLGGAWSLSLATLLRRQLHLASCPSLVNGPGISQSQTGNVGSDRLHLPLLLILWIALTGLAIPEHLTLGARTSASDFVLPLLILSAIGVAHRQNVPFVPSQAKYWMFLALLWNALALVHGVWRVGSIRMGLILSSLVALMLGYCIVCAVYSELSDMKSILQAILVFVVTGSAWNLVGLLQYALADSHGRLAGMLINPNAFAMFVSVVWVCQVTYLVFTQENRWRLLSVLNLLLLSAGLILSGSRGSWGSCLLALLLMILLFSNPRARGQILMIAVLLLVSGWFLYPWFEAQGWLAPVLERFDYERGFQSRFITDRFVLGLWTSSVPTLLIGTGTGVYSQLHALFTAGAATSVHNIYLLYLVEQGPIGVAVWFGIFIVVLGKLWQTRRSVPIEQHWAIYAAFSVLLSLLLQGVTHDVSNQRQLWLFVGLSLAIIHKTETAAATQARQLKEYTQTTEIARGSLANKPAR